MGCNITLTTRSLTIYKVLSLTLLSLKFYCDLMSYTLVNKQVPCSSSSEVTNLYNMLIRLRKNNGDIVTDFHKGYYSCLTIHFDNDIAVEYLANFSCTKATIVGIPKMIE